MRIIPSLLLASAVLSLSACMQATPYAPQSAAATTGANGYSSQMLAPDRYRVMFSGNRFTSRETVEDYLLHRAAELTRQNGYDGFTLVRRDMDRNTSVDVDTYPTAGVGAYPGFAPYYDFYGTGGGITPYDPFVGGPFATSRIDVDRISRYDATAIIDMYRGSPPAGPQPHFDASEVLARLGDTIEMPDM